MIQPESPWPLSPPYLTGSVSLQLSEDLCPTVWFSFLGHFIYFIIESKYPSLKSRPADSCSCEGGALAPFCYGNGRAEIHHPGKCFHRPVLYILTFPMDLLGSHWGWGYMCSPRTVQVGKKQILQDAKATHMSRDKRMY